MVLQRRSVRVTALVLALLLPASAAVAQSPSSSPGARALDVLIGEALGTVLDHPASVAKSEAARREADRQALGVAEIDPELPAIMAQLDVIASDLLTGYLEELAAPASPEPSSSDSAHSRRSAATRTVALAQSTGLQLTFGMASAAASELIKGWTPSPGSGSLPTRPFTTSGNFESGGRFSYYTATLSDSASFRNGVIEVAYEFTMETQVLDSATNATLESIADRGRYSASINPCPMAGGKVDSRTEAESTLTIRREGGGTRSINEQAVATGATTVNDQAEVGSTVTDLTTRRTVDGSGSSDVGFTATYGADGSQTATATQTDGSEADMRSAAQGAAAAALAGIGQLVDAARTVWRAKCLKLLPDPAGKEVFPGSETSITAKVHHEVEDADIKVPVRAELEGSESVRPADEPVEAPADFTYQAGLRPRAEAKVTFRTTSNRGIATRTETYRTSPELVLDVEGDIDASLGGEKSTYTVTGRDLKVTFGAPEYPGGPPSVRLSGRLRIRGNTRSGTGCTSRYQGSFRVSQDFSARITGGPDDLRLAFLLMAQNPNANVTVRARCPGTPSTSGKFPVAGLVSIWAALMPALEVPLAGGSATATGPTGPGGSGRQTWTATLRPADG